MKHIKLFEDFITEADAKPGPKPYMRGLDDEEQEDKEEQIKKQADMDDDDPDAYKEMPGDKEAREAGEVKTSKHVKSYHDLYGDDEETNEAAKIACLDCDEVNTAKAWKKNSDVCPSCNDSTQGVAESVINEEKAEGDRSKLDDSAESGLKKKSDETGVPIALLRIVYRRGMAAWKSGHRPGANQQQWAYARVNSFLTKQPGTWGGADEDVAKEVRDGGHDSKLKKA